MTLEDYDLAEAKKHFCETYRINAEYEMQLGFREKNGRYSLEQISISTANWAIDTSNDSSEFHYLYSSIWYPEKLKFSGEISAEELYANDTAIAREFARQRFMPSYGRNRKIRGYGGHYGNQLTKIMHTYGPYPYAFTFAGEIVPCSVKSRKLWISRYNDILKQPDYF